MGWLTSSDEISPIHYSPLHLLIQRSILEFHGHYPLVDTYCVQVFYDLKKTLCVSLLLVWHNPSVWLKTAPLTSGFWWRYSLSLLQQCS